METKDNNLFGSSNDSSSGVSSSQKTDLFKSDSFGETDTDDLFSALASKHAITSSDQLTMEFDPFGDSPWGPSPSAGTDDPFDTSAFTTKITTTTTTPVSKSDGSDLFSTPSSTTNDFDDLLNFDPLGSSKPVVTKTPEQSAPSRPVDSLFADLDPLFSSTSSPPTAADKTPVTAQAVLCEAEDDPFEVKPSQTSSTNQKAVKVDIFESMNSESWDPFSDDPFTTPASRSGDTASPKSDMETSPDKQEKKSDGAAWLDTVTVTLTKDDTDASTAEVTGQGSEFSMEEDSPVVMRRPKQKEETMAPEEADTSLDLSAIEGTEHLDVDALKQKSSLGKKGSLALRRKPSRKSVRSSLLTVVDRYQDSTEPKEIPPVEKEAPEEGSAGVQEKHDREGPENENKPKPVDRPSVLPRAASRAPPGGQILLPGLGDISKVKLRTSPQKPISGSPSPSETSPAPSGLTQPVSIAQVNLRSSQRSSLILPMPEKTTTTTATSNRFSYNPFPSKPLLQSKPRLSTEKPRTDTARESSAVRREDKPLRQPSWLREAKQPKLSPLGLEDRGEKHLQDQEPEKPAWMKASIEKRQKVAEVSDKGLISPSNKENSLPATSKSSFSVDREMDVDSSKVTTEDSENRLNELNYLHNKKSSPESSPPKPVSSRGELFIESSLSKTSRSRLCVSDMSLNKSSELQTPSKNSHMTDSLIMGSSTSIDLKAPVIRRPPVPSKQDLAPSWSRDSSNRVLPGSLSPRDEGNNQASTDLPKWKRDLLEKRRQKPSATTQISAPNDAPPKDSNNPPWQKELQNRRRSSLKIREPAVEPKQPTEPEWMRKAEERRARLAKSGLIEKK